MLETGSPISIVHVEFLLKALLTAKSGDQTEENLTDAARKRIKLPTISVCNFGVGEVNIIDQVTVNLTQGEHCCQGAFWSRKALNLNCS